MEYFILLWILFGVVTSAAAAARGRNWVGWFFIGVVIGVFGLILVLVLPNQKARVPLPQAPVEPRKPCPQCGEQVPQIARICRYCRYEFKDVPASVG